MSRRNETRTFFCMKNMRGKRFRGNSMENGRRKDREKEIVCKIRERKEKKPPLSPRNESNQVFN